MVSFSLLCVTVCVNSFFLLRLLGSMLAEDAIKAAIKDLQDKGALAPQAATESQAA